MPVLSLLISRNKKVKFGLISRRQYIQSSGEGGSEVEVQRNQITPPPNHPQSNSCRKGNDCYSVLRIQASGSGLTESSD